jgi:uncharacterized protein
MQRRIYYNVHTHVFSKHCIPRELMGSGFGVLIKALEFPQMSWLISKVLKVFSFIPISNSPIPRIKMFFRHFAQGTQDDVITHLIKNEYGKFAPDMYFKFAVLTLDMDAQDAGTAPLNYINQVGEIAEYKTFKPYREEIIPFLSIHPYNELFKRYHMMQFVKDYIEVLKFTGIKLYPATGYYPDDPRLDQLWKYCVDYEIPVMTHCTCGRIYYRGKMENRLDKNKIPYPHMTESDAQCNFTDISHFKTLLHNFPKLKLCFAHAGGVVFSKNSRAVLEAERQIASMTKRAIEYTWYLEVLNCCAQYENVYLDTSWINHDEQTIIELAKDVRQLGIENKVLYGTDFFVNLDKIDEQKAMEYTQKHFDFDLIASTNPSVYLTSLKHEYKDIQ